MRTLSELYRRVAGALDAMPASVKAEVDAAFAEHEAALAAAAKSVSEQARSIETTVSEASGDAP